MKKLFFRVLVILIVFIPLAAFAHSLIFPHETRAIFIDFSNFKRNGRIYYHPDTPQEKIDSLHTLIELGAERIVALYGQKTSYPKFIYCDREEDFLKYSMSSTVPALAHLKLGSYIILGKDGIDINIIAHELSHAELYERLGFFKRLAVPAWFDEGLAMQVDRRSYYSEKNLRIKTRDFQELPEVKNMNDLRTFQSGTREDIMLHYMAAKYEVGKWYSQEKLIQLINHIKLGNTFYEAFHTMEINETALIKE